LFSEDRLAEFEYALAHDYCFGSELANSVPRGQNRNKDHDPGAQGKIVGAALASKWVKVCLGGSLAEEVLSTFNASFIDPTVLLNLQVS
jgi:hypothetical protein